MKYKGTLHQHHEYNIAEILSMIGMYVKDYDVSVIKQARFFGTGLSGDFSFKDEAKTERFEAHLPRYTKDAFARKLNNFINEVERKSNLGSIKYVVVLYDKDKNATSFELS